MAPEGLRRQPWHGSLLFPLHDQTSPGQLSPLRWDHPVPEGSFGGRGGGERCEFISQRTKPQAED